LSIHREEQSAPIAASVADPGRCPSGSKPWKGREPQSFVAIWDTGASATCISPKISRALGVGAISMANVHAAGNSYDSPVYRINVLLPNRLVVTDIRALYVESNNHVNYDGEVAPIRVGHLSKRAPLLVEKESLPFRRSSRHTT
ncbi:MAG: hypothetical protein NT005_01295, partial [Spirochaetes bacterium]|nr:hypothetical protein [Spirochaetota bacterium]